MRDLAPDGDHVADARRAARKTGSRATKTSRNRSFVDRCGLAPPIV